MTTSIQVVRSLDKNSPNFWLSLTEAKNIDEAQMTLRLSGSEDVVKSLVVLNEEDPGIRAMVAIIKLSIEATSTPMTEALLLEIFKEGMNLAFLMSQEEIRHLRSNVKDSQ